MYLAIDIGGTKTLVAVFSSSGKLLESIRITTPQLYPDFIKQIQATYEKLSHKDEVKSCVVGAPGKINRKNGSVIAFGNIDWENVSLAADLKAILGVPCSIENDANLAGLSEASLIRHSYKKVLYITVSTGIGGIIILDGELKPNYVDMEIGMMVFENDGKIQEWEKFASGKAIYNEYGKKVSDIPEEDSSTWYKIARNLALGMTAVIANHTPDVIIIGGGVGAHFEKFSDRLHEQLMLYGSRLVSVPPMRKAIRAEEAVIYGCYELARAHQAKK